MLWQSWRSSPFKKRYKTNCQKNQERIKEAIYQILNAENPEFLGKRKHGDLKDYYAYDIGLDCRILYKLNYDKKLVEFHRVCFHKHVY